MLTQGSRNFLRNVSPTGAIADLIAVFRDAGSRRWPILALSVITTATLFSMIVSEEGRELPRPPKITYIRTFRPDRTEAEIRAENIINERHKERLAAAQRQYDEETRSLYKAVGRASGFDVDKMDREGRAEAAADEKARLAKLDQLYTAGHAGANGAASAASIPAPDHP